MRIEYLTEDSDIIIVDCGYHSFSFRVVDDQLILVNFRVDNNMPGAVGGQQFKAEKIIACANFIREHGLEGV